MRNKTKLEPCQCGNEVEILLIGNDYTPTRAIKIVCHKCGVTVQQRAKRFSHKRLLNAVAETWNTRPIETDLRAKLEKAENAHASEKRQSASLAEDLEAYRARAINAEYQEKTLRAKLETVSAALKITMGEHFAVDNHGSKGIRAAVAIAEQVLKGEL